MPMTEKIKKNTAPVLKCCYIFNLRNASWGRIQKICLQQPANMCILMGNLFSSSSQCMKRHSVLCHGTAERWVLSNGESLDKATVKLPDVAVEVP